MEKVVLTGCSKGLGLAIAQRLVKDGYFVLGLSRTLSDDYAALMEAHPEQAAFIPCDMGKLDELPTIARTISREHGAIYGLVNNAGVGLDGVLATQHVSDIEKMFYINTLGPIILTKFISRAMLSKRRGRIINISSIIASTGFHGLAAYAASKAALEGFTRSLSREVGKVGITVNAVAPGYMETEMTGGIDDEKMGSIVRRATLGLARPSDAAGAVAYLLSPDGEKITGSIITVDGGSTA